jgi:lipooligosaccharide transport system permease protein
MTAALSRPGVTAALRYCLLRYRRTWRGTIVISVANPALFLTALGYGLGKLVDERHSHYLHGASYVAFLAPGLLAAAMMQTAYLESAGPVHMAARGAGAYRVAVGTPLSTTDVMVGHLLFIAFRVATSATAFALVAFGFGAVPARGIGPLALAAVLTGAAFSAPVAAWAISVDRQAMLNAGFRFVIMPMYMFCGTFFAVSQLPGWLRTVVRCTPLYQGVALSRAAAAGTLDTMAAAGHAAYLVVLVVGGIAAGTHTYRRVLTP